MGKFSKEKVWMPALFFENTKYSERLINDGKATVYVVRRGSPKINQLEALYNSHSYSGAENTIVLCRDYRHEFICSFYLSWYPFDTQRCGINIMIAKKAVRAIDLKIGNFNYIGAKDLSQYYIKKTSMFNTTFNGVSVVTCRITLGRRLLGTLLTIYLPTVLLNIISFATNFFKVAQ